MTFRSRRIKCVIYRLDIIFSKTCVVQLMLSQIKFFCQRDIHSANSNFIPGQEVDRWQLLMFLCDTWSRYLEKLQFMHMETRQILNWASEDVSKEKLSELVRKAIAEFNDKFYHFENATQEM